MGFLDSQLDCAAVSKRESQRNHRSVSSYTCTMPKTNLTGYHDYIPRMPHTYYTHSCTINSLNVSSLTLKNYALEERTEQSKVSYLDATILNPGPGEEYYIRRMPVQNDGLWHSCIAGSDPLPWQLVSCEYLLNGSEDVGFRFQWYCDDRDPEHAYVEPLAPCTIL
jgi:hypothetical protein